MAPPNASANPEADFIAGSSRFIFDPMYAALSGMKELSGIISVTETLVRSSWIRSVREIEEYVTHIAQVRF
jgi:hypothetical protein